MTGEKALQKLLATMKPELKDGVFVFCTVSSTEFNQLDDIEPVGVFYEEEGITLIVAQNLAVRAGLPYQFECRMITLTVHSSLEAVGFLAVITQKLAESAISVNAVSAYYHDHLFVPVDKAVQAMQVLAQIIQDAD